LNQTVISFNLDSALNKSGGGSGLGNYETFCNGVSVGRSSVVSSNGMRNNKILKK
jgi:hypothetical protein